MAHTDEEIEEILQENQESCLGEIISPLCGWICWQTVQSHKILTGLTSVFGSEQARNLINLAIYVYLNSNGALQIYEDWLPQNWLSHAKTLDSSQTSALLAEVTEQQCKDYFRLRFQRVKAFYQGIELKEGDDLLPQFLALDSTCIQNGTTSTTTQYLHLYVNPDLQLAEFKDLQKKVDLVLEKYEKAEKIDNGLLSQVKSFILSEHNGKEQWSKNIKSLDQAKCTKGAWAIRTNCVQDPVKALLISRRRNVVETSFRVFKVENGGNKLSCTQSSFHGKLFVLSLAQSLRNLHLSNVNNFVDPPELLQPYLQETLKANKVKIPETDRKQMKLSGDSLTKAFSRLARYKAVRASSSQAWVMKKSLPKKDRDLISMLGCPEPPKFFNP